MENSRVLRTIKSAIPMADTSAIGATLDTTALTAGRRSALAQLLGRRQAVIWKCAGRQARGEPHSHYREGGNLGGNLAGVLGFEPRNAGTKNRCLTAWRYPNWGGSYTV